MIVLIPFGVVGSGKTTFYHKLASLCTAKLGWSCQRVSSDEIRGQHMGVLMAKTGMNRDKAFSKTKDSAKEEFDRLLIQLL